MIIYIHIYIYIHFEYYEVIIFEGRCQIYPLRMSPSSLTPTIRGNPAILKICSWFLRIS